MAGCVLVVEDDDATRQALVEGLTHAGYQVAQAANGREALAVIAAQPPDVVVLDLHMPEMDGWAFLAHLRAREGGGQIPVLIVSGTRREDWDAARVTGVLAYLPKPFHLEAVVREVAFLYDYARHGRDGDPPLAAR